jgi:hypothetical protein
VRPVGRMLYYVTVSREWVTSFFGECDTLALGRISGVGYNGGNKKCIKNACGEISLKSSSGTIEMEGEG